MRDWKASLNRTIALVAWVSVTCSSRCPIFWISPSKSASVRLSDKIACLSAASASLSSTEGRIASMIGKHPPFHPKSGHEKAATGNLPGPLPISSIMQVFYFRAFAKSSTISLVVSAKRARESMPARAIGNEIDEVGLFGVERRLDARKPRVRDGRRRQPVDDVGVPRRAGAKLALPQATAECAPPLGDAVDHRGVGLQPHPPVQPVDEDAGYRPPLVRHAGFLLDDRREDQSLFGRSDGKILVTVRPGLRQPQRLPLLHVRQQGAPVVAVAYLVAIGRQRALCRHLLDLTGQKIGLSQCLDDLPARCTLGERDPVARV